MKNTNDDEFQNELELEDEVDIAETELEDAEENSADKIKKLRNKLKECEKEKMEHLENLQRAKAEFLNGKKRLEEERTRDKDRAISNQIEKLLPMCDSFHMAMSNKEAWDTTEETWRKGIESIYTQLQSILSSYNVIEVDPTGELFNPNMHEAMTNVPVDDKKDHHRVINVVQNGFVRKIGDREELIRPARVTVGDYSE